MFDTRVSSYCNSTFLDGLHSMVSGVYSSLSGGSSQSNVNRYNSILKDESGDSLQNKYNARYDASGYYSNDSVSSDENNNKNYSKSSNESNRGIELEINNLPYWNDNFYNQERYIKNAVEGRYIYDAEEATRQQQWENQCIKSFLWGASGNIATHRVDNANLSFDSKNISIGSSSEQSVDLMSDSEYQQSMIKYNNYNLSKSPDSVNNISFVSSNRNESSKELDKYFKDHHSFEKNYLKDVEYEKLSQEKTEFWKQRMNCIHEHEESKSSSWEQKVNGGVKASGSFVRFC